MTRVSTTRILKREARTVSNTGRPIIVEIESPNLLHFREKGRRTRYTTTFEACYSLACKQYVAFLKREKAEKKKSKKGTK